MKNVQIVTLLARRPEYKDEWRIRNRFGDEHFQYRERKINLNDLIKVAETAKTRWQVHEPNTEFMVDVA